MRCRDGPATPGPEAWSGGCPDPFRAPDACAASRVAHQPKASLSDAQDLLRHKHMSTTDIYISHICKKTGSRRAAAILDLLIEEETGTGWHRAPEHA